MNLEAKIGNRSRKPGYSAPSLEKGLGIVQYLAMQSRALTASQIAVGLGLSLNEIYRIIMVMERMGWLRKVIGEKSGDKYSVTPLVLAMAFRATPSEELSTVAMPYMREFCSATDQSCHLVVRNGDSGLIVARCQNPGSTGFHVRVGSDIDLLTSCSGHVLLAFSKISGAAASLDTSVLSPFGAILHAVRQRGYERMESARTLGVTDVSLPVFDIHGDVVAALTVPFLRRIDGAPAMSLDETQDQLERTARRISAELSAPGSVLPANM